MAVKDAHQFWSRYNRLASKDLPVLLKTGIKQPTLSSWRSKRLFPRANDAVAIAAALNTTVEFLVNGKDTNNITCSPAAMNIALLADTLSDEGMHILSGVVESLTLKYHAPRRKS
jgi:transcriptional regulator with XRE-family HTH domain